jgi:hypothetical protein
MATTRRDVSAVDIAGNRLRLVDCVAQAMTHPPASRIGPRRQLGLHMMIIHSGAMSVRVDDRDRYTVSAGQMCLLLPDHEEEIRFSDEVETSQTLVRGTPVDLADPVRDWLEGLRPTRRLSSALTYLAREAVVTEQTRLTADGALVDALATSLLWRFIAEFQNYPAALPEAIEAARLYIHNHVDEEITLADIAHAASVTTSGTAVSLSASSSSPARACPSAPSRAEADSRPASTSRARSRSPQGCLLHSSAAGPGNLPLVADLRSDRVPGCG